MLSFFRSSVPLSEFLLYKLITIADAADSSQAETSSTRFLNAIPTDYQFSLPNQTPARSSTYTSELSKTCRLETERRYARERYDRVLREVLELEDQMGITKRWTPATLEYIETVRYISERRYHQALNNLQRLVTLRLFELHRLNLSGVGRCSSPPAIFLS